MQDCPSLAASLKPLAHCQNVASLNLFYRCFALVDVHLNWLNWSHFLYILEGVLLVILIDFMMSMSAASFLAQLDSGMLSFDL